MGEEVDYFSEQLTGFAGLKAVSEGNQKMQEALDKLRQELTVNDNLSRALGEGYDYVGGWAKILEGGVKSLIEVGFSPMGSTVQGLIQDMRGLAVAIDTLPTRTVKGLEKANETPDFKLQVPELEKVPDVLPDYGAIFGLAAQSITANGGKMQAALEPVKQSQSQLDFNTNMGQFAEQLSVSVGPLLANFADH